MLLWFPITLFIFISTVITGTINNGEEEPFRIGVAGLSHGHVHWILARHHDEDLEIAGIAEPNSELAQSLMNQYSLDKRLWYPGLEEMLDSTTPEAVCAFGSTYDHLKVVEICAPRGIHVMVEKPLAVNISHARKINELASRYGIQVLTNYETTWYPTNHRAFQIFKDGRLGDVRKIVVRDGHQGPKEIGVNKEFLSWLTDPEQNGAGALMDFGCYGANLSTWFMDNQKPISVIAVTQQFKPDTYPKVEDEAIIILTYPHSQTIVEASWNWPFSRKDMELYGERGYVISHDRHSLSIRLDDEPRPSSFSLSEKDIKYHDPFKYLADVVQGEVNPAGSLSSLENNMIVMEILDAAIKSAQSGKSVEIGD